MQWWFLNWGQRVEKNNKKLAKFLWFFQQESGGFKYGYQVSYVTGAHKFLDKFINQYINNKEFRERLMVSHFKGYVYKVKGVANPPRDNTDVRMCSEYSVLEQV